MIVNPWGSELIQDYERLIKNFGLKPFSPLLLPNPNILMRRNAVFAHQDLEVISNCIKNKKKYYALTGIMPTGNKIHFGNKMVVENLIYFQEHNAKTYILVADLEASATRNVSLEEAKKRALDFHIPAYIALGLNPKKTIFYFQSENKKVMHLTYDFSKKITLNEFKAIYGIADPSRILSGLTQAADMLFPQLEEKIPGIIPVGPDQSPHLRLARDIINRTKSSYNFSPLASIYHKFTPSLDGSIKMSKSSPNSSIELPENQESACKKLKNAVSGGRKTLEEHKKLGGIPEKDMVFEMLKLHLEEDDKKLEKIYNDYKSGKLTTKELKEIGCEKLTIFLNNFSRKLEKAKKQTHNLNFITFN
ncbi:tryptophan--tRNA ligase [Candidatus Woesearchaeota archaeon]|nr:tryptophan--tRNA ligase [Candidatus Woesearchaeota archaeon]